MEDTDRLADMVVSVEAHMEVPICRPSQAAAVVGEQVAGFAAVEEEEAVAE